jgi:hypothetical protein
VVGGGAVVLSVLAIGLSPGVSHASPEFPGAILEAADMKCVPVCTLCHTSNPGTATTWQQKALPRALASRGVHEGDADSLKAAWNKYMNDAAVPLADRQAVAAAVKAGKDQYGTDVCGPTYGCGAHIAQHAPPRDSTAPLWILGAALVGGLLRRRKTEA